MKKLKRFVNKNYKVVIGFIIGIIVCVGIGVSAVATKDITYDNSTSGLTSTNMQGAIDELNTKATTKIEEAKNECPEGYKCSKVCTVTSGNGTKIGDEITCGTESFYVLENDGTNITALAKYNLEIGYNCHNGSPTGSELTAGTQNSNCLGQVNADVGAIFNGITYNTSTCATIGLDSKLTTYLSNYKTYLKNTVGLPSSIIVSNPSLSMLQAAGCSSSSCSASGRSWLYSTSYWLSDITSERYRYAINGTPRGYNGEIWDDGDIEVPITFGIRPVIKMTVNVI